MSNSASGLGHYWRILVGGKWVIIGGTIFLLAVTALISFLLPPVYEASMIIEVGSLYPVPEEGIKKEPELIEEPMAMAELLRSGEFLDNTRKELGLDLTILQMEKRLSVEQIVAVTRFQRSESTLVRASWEDHSPELGVRVLDSLASQLVEEHRRLYQATMKNFQERISSLREKIVSSRRVISSQKSYQETLRERIKEVENSIADYEETIGELNFSGANINELLFFKSALNALKEQLIKLEVEINIAELNIGEEEENIQEARDWIANIEGYMALSRNTAVRSRPVLPDEPVSPDKSLNLTLAGVFGLLLTVLFVFFGHYIRSEE